MASDTALFFFLKKFWNRGQYYTCDKADHDSCSLFLQKQPKYNPAKVELM